MNRIKKMIALTLAAVLCFALAACGVAESKPAEDAKVLTAEDYANIIMESRPAEDNEYLEVVAGGADLETTMVNNPSDLPADAAAENIGFMMDSMGLDASKMEKFAFSMSMMNIKVYSIGIYKPAEGMEADVKAELEAYVKSVQDVFETYLPDQYEVAKAAIIKEMDGGEIMVIMHENAEEIAEKIEAAL